MIFLFNLLMIAMNISFLSAETRNVYNEPIEVCSLQPKTGYFRDGYCKTNQSDRGKHLVCAQVTQKFLDFSKNKGNDLITKTSYFPGLREGDHWCLCIDRWKEAFENGINLKVKYKSSHIKAKETLFNSQ